MHAKITPSSYMYWWREILISWQEAGKERSDEASVKGKTRVMIGGSCLNYGTVIVVLLPPIQVLNSRAARNRICTTLQLHPIGQIDSDAW